nr:retropepsin-like aspartic protease [Hyphomonas sp. Mor2]
MTQQGLTIFSFVRAGALALAAGMIAVCLSPAEATEKRSLILNHSETARPFTDVVINGVETSALLDTGATIPLIGDRFLDLDPILEVEGASEVDEARILGIGGQKFYPVSRLPKLSAGSENWTDLRVAVNTENRYPIQKSVLPISIFETRVVDFDFNNRRVHLYDGKPKRVRRARHAAVPYQDVNSLIFVPIKINGVYGRALIDTGADISFLNPTFASESKAKLDEERTALLRGSDLNNNRASIYRFRRVIFAENEITRITLPVLDTELFDELGFADEPMMILGMDLLQHFRLQVDRERQQVHFNRSFNPPRYSAERPATAIANGVTVR